MIDQLHRLLHQRFGRQPYWLSLQRELEWSAEKLSPLRVVSDQEAQALSSRSVSPYSLRSFLTSWQEVMKLRQQFQSWMTEQSSQQVVKQQLICMCDRRLTRIQSRLRERIAQVLQDSSVTEDVVWFAQQFMAASQPERLVAESAWIDDPSKRQLHLCLGPDLLWLVTISRCLGLIELQRLRRLRSAHVVVLGASVAAMTADLLVSLGVQQVSCIDPGVIEPSNSPRLPAGDVTSWGFSKSGLLRTQLLRRNPYGVYSFIQGKVICTEEERTSPTDRILKNLVTSADLILEVIDDVQVKIKVQSQLRQSKPDIPLLFIADLGNQPVVKVIDQVDERLTTLLRNNASDPSELQVQQQLAYLMVEGFLPPEQALQFLLSCMGVLPFWSQTPIASRASAALAATAILNHLCDKPLPDQYFGMSIADPLLNAKKDVIFQACRQFLGIGHS